MKRKLIALSLIIISIFALGACDKDEPDANDNYKDFFEQGGVIEGPIIPLEPDPN